jgi:hypothetical protein
MISPRAHSLAIPKILMIFKADENTTIPSKYSSTLRKIDFHQATLPMQRGLRCRSINKVSGGKINIQCWNSQLFYFY